MRLTSRKGFICENPAYIRLEKDSPQESRNNQDMDSDDPGFVLMIKFVYLLNPLKPAATAPEQLKAPVFIVVRG